MKLLAIDTSTVACSAALAVNGKYYTRYQVSPRTHSQIIYPMFESLFEEANIEISEIDIFAFGRGPGSFTGVRIAASIIQALAFACNKPVVPVSTLQAMAQGAVREFSATHVASAIDARMNEVYYNCYALDSNGIMQPISDEQVSAPEKITLPGGDDFTAVGNGWQQYYDKIPEDVKQRLHEVHSEFLPQAQDIAYIANELYKRGQFVTAEQALPVYLRDKVTN